MFNQFWNTFITANITFSDNTSYRRVILINTILFFTILIFLFFTFFNLAMEKYLIALFDALAGVSSSYALYHLRRYKKIQIASLIATTNLTLFFILFVYTNGADHFGLIWTIFLPIFAIFLNGKRIGLSFATFFYLVIYAMAYNNICVWSEGLWQMADFVRLVFSSLILTYAIYANEFALERSDKELQNVRKSEERHISRLKALSVTDELTELYNRRHYNDLAPKLLALAKRRELYVTFFILDIDHFKAYNDNYGHQAGDEALVKVANVIKKHIQRNDDFVFRLGGDEFAGITLSTNPQLTHTYIDNICREVEALKIRHEYSSVSNSISTSIGIVTISPMVTTTLDKLYRKADLNLYKAKEEGKNQCYFSLEEI